MAQKPTTAQKMLMKAIVQEGYGSPVDVLELKDVAKPVPKDDEVLVRVRAASVNPYDWHLVTGLPYFSRVQFGLRKPKASGPGADLAGEVEAIGRAVTEFGPGHEVFGGVETGSFAQYVCVPESALVLKPASLTFEQAGAIPVAGLTALQGLRDKGRLRRGQTVLINGASGGVGTFAVQIAASLGAEVTGVCSTRNVDMVRSLGAEHVIDYSREDFTRGGLRYDVILDNVGNHSASKCRRVLNPRGVYVASFGQPDHRWLGPLAHLLRMYMVSPFVSQKMVTWVSQVNQNDLNLLKDLIESGDVKPVIDRTYPLGDVPEAIGYLEEGHTRGKIAITV